MVTPKSLENMHAPINKSQKKENEVQGINSPATVEE